MVTRRDRRLAQRRRSRRRRALSVVTSLILGVIVFAGRTISPPTLSTVAQARADAATQPADASATEATPVEPVPTDPEIDDSSTPASPGAEGQPGSVDDEPETTGEAATPVDAPATPDDAQSVEPPWADTVAGVLTFRGSPTRSYYGEGPMPTDPAVLWRYPDQPMCGETVIGAQRETWCGMGWTGQPAVFDRDGKTWLTFGAYDHNVHFVDAESGTQLRSPVATGDIIKGSATVDPDGYPLVYIGSRDNRFRAVAFDREPAEVLWSLDASAVSPTMWNNDWDSSALVLDGYLLEGGENSRFHVAELNRGFDGAGRVVLDPELVFDTAGWDDQLLRDHGTANVSIENSVAVHDNVAYFANSGGLVQGWDLSPLAVGGDPVRVFRFWTGDDTDATIVIDEEGMLYVGSEFERNSARSREIGQMMKLDPSRPDDPLVWSIPMQTALPDGVWATAALHRDVLYVPTHTGVLHAIDRTTGAIRWTKQLDGKTWSSPVVIDDVLIQGDCGGTLRAYDVADTTIEPTELWALNLDGGCIEGTPVVWGGRIHVATRSGYLYAIAQR